MTYNIIVILTFTIGIFVATLCLNGKKMITLLIDGYNFLHRARAGFHEGEYTLVYTFMRNLRSLIEQMTKQYGELERVVFVIEGHPAARYKLLPEYKANRKIDIEVNSSKHHEMVEFHRQKEIIIQLLKSYFPIEVMRHSNYECDDVIYNIVAKDVTNTQFVVVSNDTDFIQLLQRFPNTSKVWNAMQKCEVVAPQKYDYVNWKSLVGDGSDNIPGFKGVGPKTAEKLLKSEAILQKFFDDHPNSKETFERNHRLISFYDLSNDEWNQIEKSNPNKNWDALKEQFTNFQFASIINDKSWEKFVGTFDTLWKI